MQKEQQETNTLCCIMLLVTGLTLKAIPSVETIRNPLVGLDDILDKNGLMDSTEPSLNARRK